MPEPKQTRPKSGYSLAEYEVVKRELDKLVAAGVICDGKRHDAWQAEMAEIERKWKPRIERLIAKYPHGWPPDSHESRLFHMYARRKVQAQIKCTAKHFPPRPHTGAPVVPDKPFMEQVENLAATPAPVTLPPPFKSAAVQTAPAAPAAVKGAEKPASGWDDISLEARAVAVLMENSTWTQKRIAETIGCTRQSLYNMPEYQRVRHVLKASRQTRKKTGTLGKIGSHTDIDDDDNDGD